MELSGPVIAQRHGYLSICPTWICPWAKDLSNLETAGPRLCETTGRIFSVLSTMELSRPRCCRAKSWSFAHLSHTGLRVKNTDQIKGRRGTVTGFNQCIDPVMRCPVSDLDGLMGAVGLWTPCTTSGNWVKVCICAVTATAWPYILTSKENLFSNFLSKCHDDTAWDDSMWCFLIVFSHWMN